MDYVPLEEGIRAIRLFLEHFSPLHRLVRTATIHDSNVVVADVHFEGRRA